jgi:hypothetical protein
MTPTTVTVDMNKRCAECEEGGATDSGICLECTIRAMKYKPMTSWQGRAVAKRFRTMARKT